jgi:hypothetical protein
MSSDPRAELAAVLTVDGPAAAMRALRLAIAWTATALAEATGAGDADAMEAVIALDDALTETESLAEPLEELTRVAVTGEPVAAYLRHQLDALSALADRTAVLRRENEALLRVEEQLAAAAAEHERLTARLDELRRYERLSEALPELRTQQEALAGRLAAMRQPVRAAEQALLDTAEQVLTLSSERLADLGDHTETVLTKIAAAERDWATEVREHEKLKDRLAANLRRYDRMRAEHAERAAQLAEYARIDAEILAGLPGGVAGVPDGPALLAALEDAARTLRRVDGGLRAALEEHDRLLATTTRLIQWYDPVTEGGA